MSAAIDRDDRFREDSFLWKMVSCIPVVGIVPSSFATTSLDRRIPTESSAIRLAELILVKNRFKESNIFRNITSIALIVSAFALGFFPGALYPTLLMVACAEAAWSEACAIPQNKKIISELTSGLGSASIEELKSQIQ